ncbi:MAG TPA: hypothetical protein VMH91_03240 [Candidatus Paceibacterota bacterium]|nr:hypothetical protein [Candidatus Paceibacterota bacterium]
MNTIPSGTDRTQPIVDALFNNAIASVGTRKRGRGVYDGVQITRPRGRFGSEPTQYDFGNRYSVPAIVVDGKVQRLA